MVASRDNFPLLAELLASQQHLDTPVARFAAAPATAERAAPQLIPLTAPRPGEHYAFEVDLDACSGCKSCVAACHSLNGLDPTETWRDVGLILSPDAAHPFAQTVTTACHHCADPACLNGCPVLAYEKDPATGIVRHLDDQCIGCSYCILKCPYDVPKFNARLGIVRKCDMCHGRLAAGEAPACAQACPTHAIRIVTVATPRDRAASSAAVAFLPAAPDPAYTSPTTRYVSKFPLPAGLVAADAAALRPQPAHWPLAVLLVFSQAGLGLLLSSVVGGPAAIGFADPALLGFTLFVAGLLASVVHLGQPWRAWRVFLGLRRSWLSREAVALGAAAACFALYFAATGFVGRLGAFGPVASVFAGPSFGVGLVLALVGVASSAMLYIDTRRRAWGAGPTTVRMAGTVLVAAAVAVSFPVAAVLLSLKLAAEAGALRGPTVSARLLRGPLRFATTLRFTLGLATVAALLVAPASPKSVTYWVTLYLFLLGELAERHLYFRAVDSPKMPGVPA